MSENKLMCTRLEKYWHYEKHQITGIAKRCDWFVCREQFVNITDTSEPKTVFLSNYYGNVGIKYFFSSVLPKINNKYILIIASEDGTFPSGIGEKRFNHFSAFQTEIQQLIASDNLIKIFVENLDTLHPKLVPIPLGSLNTSDGGLYKDLLTYHPIDFSKKTIDCFCCHRVRSGPQWDDRINVTRFCKNEWKDFVTYNDELSNEQFKDKLLESKFCICVHGGGYDPSPRAWYALLCGAIPIITHSPLDAAYQRFPVIYIDQWNPGSITQEKLNQWFDELRGFFEDREKREEVLKMLSIDYWWDIITADLHTSVDVQ